MTTTNTTNDCSRLRDDLASLADDEPAAVDAHADHLAECDECRDARHEARTIARALATAGDEFEETDDFHARLMRAVDVGLAADHAGGTPSRSARPTPTRRPAISDERRRAAPVERRAGAPAASTRSSRRLATVALACAAVLACAAIGVRQLWMARSTSSTTAPSAATPPLSGRLQTIARSGDEPGVTGMTLRSADGASPTAATAGDAVPAGATVRTDARTRARLTLSDGSTLVLDHDTEVALDARAPRGVRLEHGAIVADVTHLPDGPRASFSTPQGRIEVLGTKFVLTAADSRTNVEVVRGAIRLAPLAGRDGWAQVQAGQEGIVGQDGKPRVMPATHLASAVEWAELDTPGEAEPNGSSGLGVLRARRPGETGSREHPLSLSSHRVSVRIAGTVARTEIEERFANDGAHVLEGTYEFPLPADARIVRLALDVEGRLVDGAIVERDRATKIWAGVLRHATPVAARARKEEFVWVPGPWRDPALLEWRSGGRFGLRIFPIPAHGERRIVLTYEQVIAPRGDTRRYVYPLPHPVGAQPRAAHFEMDARVAGIDPSVPVTARGYEARVSRACASPRRTSSPRATSWSTGRCRIGPPRCAPGRTRVTTAPGRCWPCVPRCPPGPRRGERTCRSWSTPASRCSASGSFAPRSWRRR